MANFIFALFALYLMFLIGVPSIKPLIGNVIANSIAAQAKLINDTEIISVAGNATRNWQEVNLALIGQIGNEEIEIKTKKSDSLYISTFMLDTRNWQFSPDKTSALTSLGITPFRPKVHNELAVIGDKSPAALAGLQVSDKLISVGGVKTNDWLSFAKEIKRFPGQEVLITISRNNQIISLPVTPDSVKRSGRVIGYIGVAPKADVWPEEFLIELSYGPIEAIKESAQRTWNLTSLTFSMIGKLITGDVSVKNLSGPIGIAQGAGNSAGHGFVYFLGFLALISINLGIINLLPLPVLDGGHLLYYLIELFTGKEVPVKVQEVGFKFGALALLMLMAIGLFNDFSRVLG
jgi:regulator of sigma E protease